VLPILTFYSLLIDALFRARTGISDYVSYGRRRRSDNGLNMTPAGAFPEKLFFPSPFRTQHPRAKHVRTYSPIVAAICSVHIRPVPADHPDHIEIGFSRPGCDQSKRLLSPRALLSSLANQNPHLGLPEGLFDKNVVPVLIHAMDDSFRRGPHPERAANLVIPWAKSRRRQRLLFTCAARMVSAPAF